MRTWMLPLLAIGCRVGFDARGDAATGPGEAISTDGPPRDVQLIQQISIAGGSQISEGTAFVADVQLGNLLVVAIDYNASSREPPTVTDALGNAFTVIGQPSGTPTALVAIATAPVTRAGHDAITVTRSTPSSSFFEVRLHEFSGVDPDVLGRTGVASGTTTAIDGAASPGITTTVPAMIFGFGAYMHDSAVGTGFILCESDFGDLTEYRVGRTAGTYVATSTSLGAGDWTMMVAAIPTR